MRKKNPDKPAAVTSDDVSTPLMKQYLAIKAQHQEAVLFFRMGDFYEMFYDDAKVASEVLGLTLTSRAHGKSAEVPLAGFPYHALDTYLTKMVKSGHRIAICEQVEDPKLAKGVVKREVVEIVTPGTVLSDNLLDSRRNNFLLAVYAIKRTAGLAQIDLSTGEFWLDEAPVEEIRELVLDSDPAEIIVADEHAEWLQQQLRRSAHAVITIREGWQFAYDHAYETLTRHFNTLTLKGFGCDDLVCGICAGGAALLYLRETQKRELTHITQLARRSHKTFVAIDPATRRNLELVRSNRGEHTDATLLSAVDCTKTAMGGRLMMQWLLHPLLVVDQIRERHDGVEELLLRKEASEELRSLLSQFGDLERLIAKVTMARANARELNAVRHAQSRIPQILQAAQSFESAILKSCAKSLDPLLDLTAEISRALVDDPPLAVTEGKIIRPGYSEELDKYRQLATHGKDWIADLQKTEREKTGIASLKVGFNKVFGYYLEVTKPNLAKVPDSYIRKQTLVNAERYITPELKEFEEQVLQAEEKMIELEYRLFDELRQKVAQHAAPLQENARALARLDCLLAFAESAARFRYVRPTIDDSDLIDIKAGRHPVIERRLPFGEKFVPNDVYLDTAAHQVLIITGPNMAGKSTYLRQVALIVLMAQIGSFVPADSATIGIVDKVFTRVGASDNLAEGESTFLVEMNETANILNNATAKSLLLLDEIGRGTSTYDGLSIAWAVVEYLHENTKVAARTLFATHYHELTELANRLARVQNYNVLVKEWGDQVVFLRRIVEGGCDHSYGIQVARLAGLPASVIDRAKQVLHRLEQQSVDRQVRPDPGTDKAKYQIDLFAEQERRIKGAVLALDINRLTPLQAIQELANLQKLAKDGNPSASEELNS